MHKILLLTFFTLCGGQLALAQDDDAELGKVPAESSDKGESSLIEESDATPPVEPQEVREPKPAPVVQERRVQREQPDEAAPSPPPPAKDGSPGFIASRRRPGATFGFAVAKPYSIGKYNHYDYLYGKKRAHPTFYAGYYLASYFFDLGLVGRMGYYHAQGHPLKTRDSLVLPLKSNLTTEALDYDQKIGLTLIPVQGTVELALAPFKTRWIVLRGWFGYEQLYVTETIEPNLPSTTTSSSSATYSSTGSNSGLVTGAMVSFSLTGLVPQSDYSLRSLGIDRLYLSIYTDIAKTSRDKMGNFDRKTYGIAFSFEGLR